MKIKLAVNFQQIEFDTTVDAPESYTRERLIAAVDLLNELSARVGVQPASQASAPKEELASEKQILWLRNLKVEFDPATITKKHADELIRMHKKS